MIRCQWTYIAGDSAVQLDLLDERRVTGQGVRSGHGVLVGLLVKVLIKIQKWKQLNRMHFTSTEKQKEDHNETIKDKNKIKIYLAII